MRTIICAAIAATFLATSPHAAVAAAADYKFEAAKPSIVSGEELAVKLFNTTTGQPVVGAVIFKARLDMSPDGMEGMTAALEPVPATEPGIYKFRAKLTMSGRWLLRLEAKVQGEADTVAGDVVFTAAE